MFLLAKFGLKIIFNPAQNDFIMIFAYIKATVENTLDLYGAHTRPMCKYSTRTRRNENERIGDGRPMYDYTLYKYCLLLSECTKRINSSIEQLAMYNFANGQKSLELWDEHSITSSFPLRVPVYACVHNSTADHALN